MARMAALFEEMGFARNSGAHEPRPQYLVAKTRKILAMKRLRRTTSKTEFAAAVIKNRERQERVAHPKIGTALVDPEDVKALPGKFQVALASKKPMSKFRKGEL